MGNTMDYIDILIYLVGGFLAGVATGMVGLSAATIIAPLFATMLGMDAYLAIGIALATDVFASATSASTYIKHKNINLKNAKIMAVAVLIFTILGSYLSSFTNPNNLNSAINIFVFLLGIRFLVYPVKKREVTRPYQSGKLLIVLVLFFGGVIGFISGFFGAGGGLSMLALLTMVLGYDLKNGVGTSVFIMVFIALVGAISHFIIAGTLLLPLLITSVAAFIGANIASRYANHINEILLNRVIGVFLIIYGLSLIIVQFIY